MVHSRSIIDFSCSKLKHFDKNLGKSYPKMQSSQNVMRCLLSVLLFQIPKTASSIPIDSKRQKLQLPLRLHTKFDWELFKSPYFHVLKAFGSQPDTALESQNQVRLFETKGTTNRVGGHRKRFNSTIAKLISVKSDGYFCCHAGVRSIASCSIVQFLGILVPLVAKFPVRLQFSGVLSNFVEMKYASQLEKLKSI